LIDIDIESHNLKHAKIEPLIIPEEKLQELKAVLADPKLADVRKSFVMRRISGTCLVCGQMPSYLATYKMLGITRIEKYCDECLARINKNY
jgi:hypothetical protein